MSRRPLRYVFQLALGKTVHDVVGELATGKHGDADALATEEPGDLPHALGNRAHVEFPIRVHVRRRNDDPCSLARRGPRQPRRLRRCPGSVVDPGKQMKVRLDEARDYAPGRLRESRITWGGRRSSADSPHRSFSTSSIRATGSPTQIEVR